MLAPGKMTADAPIYFVTRAGGRHTAVDISKLIIRGFGMIECPAKISICRGRLDDYRSINCRPLSAVCGLLVMSSRRRNQIGQDAERSLRRCRRGFE
jgi:hypothetical protein